MTNSSATGGYLQPSPPPAPAPLEGEYLLAFLQQWMVGITGLPGNLVRPRWQIEPPSIPQSGTCWAALGIMSRPSDDYPFVGWVPASSDYEMYAWETLEILTSFYDTGQSGQADYTARLFRDGIFVPQNRETLTAASFGIGKVGSLTTVPSLLKLRWLYRVDLPVTMRRQITRVYPVEALVAATGTVSTDEGLAPQPFAVGTSA